MPLRRSGQLEDRRRRVLNDSLARDQRVRRTGGWSGARVLGRSRNYGDAEFLDELPRITELIPVNWMKSVIVAASGAGVIAGLLVMHAWAARCVDRFGGNLPEAIDLTAHGSLAVWLSTIVWAAAGLAALVILSVRRHRRDDYNGAYRIWLWGAVCCGLLSIDMTTGLHRLFAKIATAATGTALYGDGALWWIAVGGFVFGGIGMRLLVDMRRCRIGSAAMIAAGCCYGAALAERLLKLPALDDHPLQRVLAAQGLLLAGHWLVLVSMLVYARHVLLDAMGLLPDWGGDDYLEEEPEIEASEQGAICTVTVHPPHGVPRPASVSIATPVTTSPSKPLASSWQATAAYLADPTTAPPPATTISYGAGASAASVTPSVPLIPQVSRKLTKEEKRRLRDKLERARRERDGRGY